MPDAAPKRPAFARTHEIEEWTNLVFVHPLSERFARLFARLGVHPNVVSLLGMALGVAAGAAYHRLGDPAAVVAGFLLMVGWHVMDGADGQLARLTGKTSEVGKVLDGLADHVAFAAVYLGLATALAEVHGPAVWLLAIAAGVSHAVQSAAYEYRRQSYDYFVHGKAARRVPTPEAWRRALAERTGAARLFGAVYLVYLRVQHAATGGDANARVEQALREAADPAAVRDAYRRAYLKAVRAWAVLCSNYRTIAVFACALAGFPAWYFVYEVVVLNAALVLLTRMQRRRDEALREVLADV